MMGTELQIGAIMRWILLSQMIGAALALSSAADVKIAKSLPFEISITSARDMVKDGQSITALTAQIKNGPSDVSNITIHCQAKNSSGNTWDIGGKTSNLDAGESRSFILNSSPGDPALFSHPTLINCMVSGFEIPIVVDP